MIDLPGANTEIKTLFWTAFEPLYSPTVPVRWVEKEEPGAPTAPLWVSFEIIHAVSEQSAFTGGPQKRYTSKGAVLVRCYARKSRANADESLMTLAEDIRDIFRGTTTPGGVWFRNASVKTVGLEGLYYRSNVQVDFEFDTLK